MKKKLIIFGSLLILTLIGINMYNSQKTIWYEGTNKMDCKMEHV